MGLGGTKDGVSKTTAIHENQNLISICVILAPPALRFTMALIT
jgi:hypothetical protein